MNDEKWREVLKIADKIHRIADDIFDRTGDSATSGAIRSCAFGLVELAPGRVGVEHLLAKVEPPAA